MEFDAESWNEAVAASTGVDPWCSHSIWLDSARQSWSPDEPVLHLRAADAQLLAQRIVVDEDTTVLAGLERVWGFGATVAGPDRSDASALLKPLLSEEWAALVLTGVDIESGAARRLLADLSSRFTISVAGSITRQHADLGGGLDAWLARRSSKFRRGLARSERLAAARGLTLEVLDTTSVDVVLERSLAVERSSWKGLQDSGIVPDDLRSFYARVLEGCRRSGAIRAAIATLDGEDVGYVLGGRLGTVYRGLQISYSEHVAELGVGNLLQLHELRRLAAEPNPISTYDLGMDMEYKRRWADRPVTTHTVLVRR